MNKYAALLLFFAGACHPNSDFWTSVFLMAAGLSVLFQSQEPHK